MEVASEIMKGVVQVLMVPVKKQLDYIVSYRKYVDDMHTKMTELNVAKASEEVHLDQNTRNRLEVPAQVRGWLEKVESINAKVENFPSEVLGCLDLKSRHKLGRKASKTIKEIDSLATQRSLIQWTNDQIPVGRIDSTLASTSTPSSDHNVFRSRDQTFTEALKALGPTHDSHIVALCGMGGVGKSTMMKKLKQVVIEKEMFNDYVEAVIGEKTDPISIQQAVAEYLGIQLTESTRPARTQKLRKWFADNSDGGKKKFLVILDDVWQPVDLEDIGLSRLPNQGVNFKVLITSRDKAVCTEMGVKDDYVLKVSVLEESEAHSLFRQLLEPSDDVDPELHKVGEQIVRKCCGLPIAIKIMACTLRGKRKDTWKNALSRLEHRDINTVAPAVFKTSYDNLQDEVTEATFLLCGLFPEDFNILTEDLLRYGWGLRLFKGVGTIREARYRLNACIERLTHTHLLIESDKVGCVKMHDLVRAFVLDMFSKEEHASIVNHGSNPGWPEAEYDVRDSCKGISLTCKGMTEFPSDLKFSNLSILKLMHGDKSLRFPQEFYGQMEKLQVISFDKLEYTLLPSSTHQCSTSLRVLRLHECSLAFDFSSIGNLRNLEVLIFVNSGIQSLPSTFRNLRKLRVLDMKNYGDFCIDNGVFKNLIRLEELYACRSSYFGSTISFTGDNYNEVAERWKNLSTLEFEFLENNAQWKNLSFENLERFKISVGRSFKEDNHIKVKHLLWNTLKLVAKRGEVLGSRINKLFEKSAMLCISVDDMKDLEDVGVKSSLRPETTSFRNLRILVVSECLELEYLFTLGVANGLSNLEHLEVFYCPVMKELIHLENGGEERVTFPKVKFLSLCGLPNLSCLCQSVNIIALPQLMELTINGLSNITSIYSKNESGTSCLLKDEVLIPKLEKLRIEYMKDLKEIWPCQFKTSKEVKLRVIEVSHCENLVNLFPCNPMPLLHHLEGLKVEYCNSIEVLFIIDLDCVRETGESCSTSLRRIEVNELGRLQEVWRIEGANHSCLPICGFQAVESIWIGKCKRFRNVFTPTVTNFNLGALIYMNISESGEIGRKYGLMESSQRQEINFLSKEETSEVSDIISYTLFPSGLVQSFHNLHDLQLREDQGVEVIFEIESAPTSHDNQQRLFPYLEELEIRYMVRMSHVWKCNWNKFLILQKQQSESPFHHLTTIYMSECYSIKYLFSPLMARLLSNLKKVEIEDCYGIEEVVSQRDDEDKENTTFTSTSTPTSTIFFPHLDSLIIKGLHNLKCIGGGGGNNEIYLNKITTTTNVLDRSKLLQFSQLDGVPWSLGQYPREIIITKCHALSSVVPCYAAGEMHKLQVLKIDSCSEMKEVFETQEINRSVITLRLSNLKILEIMGCGLLGHIFTFATLENLEQLEELRIKDCKAMKVIVKEEDDGEQKTVSSSKAVVFPRLKCIELFKLTELLGFFLGTNEFHWPSLDRVVINDCPQLKVFTAGGSTAPQLKYVETSFGKHSPGCWFNSHVTTTTTGQHHEAPFLRLESTSSWCPAAAATLEEIDIWSFHNLIELHVKDNRSVEKIIPSNELLQLQKLENIHVSFCRLVKEVFEALEGTNSGFDESQTTFVKLANLTQLELESLPVLRHIWKSNRYTVFEFPNLTRVSLDDCGALECVFTSSMVGSLLQLQELLIRDCENMEEVFVEDGDIVVEEEEEESDGKTNEIVFPRLKSLKLEELPCLKGFCLGKALFSFPLLDTLNVKYCTAITTFTTGNLSTPELKEIETGFGSFYVEEDVNSFIKMKQEEFKRDER